MAITESRLVRAAFRLPTGNRGSFTGNDMEKPLLERLPRMADDAEKLLKQLAGNEKMAELGRLSAGIVHEINTPLSVIAAASQMILSEKDLPDQVAEMVERIFQEVHRLSQLTRSILSFSREDNSSLEDTDLSMVIRDVLIFLEFEIRKRSVLVTEELEPGLPSIAADPNQLKQIFLNLIVNALQAMGQGGRLAIAASSSVDGLVRIVVRDTGPGIPDEYRERIFDPFFTTKDPGEGTGLGLFITKSHVERLGGRIEVASEVGRGTSFILQFPASGHQ
jgi:two-component system NtrC family sensor kinase